MSNVQLITYGLGEHLQKAIEQSDSIYILTSFVMDSGVNLLAPSLRTACERGAEVKLLAGDYLHVTQPKALARLIDIHPDIEVRLWQSNGQSFHPKAYLFQQKDGNTFVVGSSNLSSSALVSGVEWNVIVNDEISDTFENALTEFMQLFYHEQTVPVNHETIKVYEQSYHSYHQQYPNLIRNWTETEEADMMLPVEEKKKQPEVIVEPSGTYGTIHPRPAQHEALEALFNTYEEGYHKAMVVMATGLGKTYLAGFFAERFARVLFIAHREELLHQAKASFQTIMPERTGGLYYRYEKTTDTDFVFASVYTLSMEKHLHRFRSDDFDLIIVDEFHHAAATTYQRVIDYFQPKFLLGITATPDRMDQKDVYALCDGNVAYQLHFIEAIQKGWLTPFRYFGVYDETDYSGITWLGKKYDQQELLAVQLRKEYAENILQAWLKHKQTRTLCFCSSIGQANFLADFFQKKGYQTISLHSKTIGVSRSEAIKQLNEGVLDVIFTVDLFNEGVDIPSVDTLLFVRPTESLTIFTQQVGRGLRLHAEKEYCAIIDLIGNYRNADIKLSLFQLEPGEQKKKAAAVATVPVNCELHLETEVINLLEELAKKRQPRKEALKQAYLKVKQELGRRPTYLELHLRGTEPSKTYYQEFKSYAGFLYWANELTEREQEAFRKYECWLVEVERTGMVKSYKMVVLLYMLQRGQEHWADPVTPQEVAPFFHHYLTETEYRKRIDFSDKSSKQMWDYDEKKVSKLIADMPMTKWSGSSKGLISFEDGQFIIHLDIDEQDQEILYEWTKEICEYRLHQYFERKAETS
ncbi:DEAD/DEAH box helicase family protein [Bacillus songklensis]|uniref:DEAD/DEAH box helicase family protein n=1 Tax=Bacillus songklensis TaxID=1069116 RepID=A0ABV8B8S5_9BACI